MYIDYDGINNDFQYEVNQAVSKMIDMLKHAMENDEVTSCSLTFEWQICSVCRGDGGHSRRLGVIDSETMNDWDDDEIEFYFSGGYDETCESCNGSGKVKALFRDRLPEDVVEWIDNYERDVYDYAAERRAERMMGA